MILRAVTGAKGPGAPPPGRAPDRPQKNKKTKDPASGCRPLQDPPKKYGRGDWIRTSGPYVPNVLLYQTEPHLVAVKQHLIIIIPSLKKATGNLLFLNIYRAIDQ